ncbi:hypothetical protein M0811_01907 [Anaeramoeba ignava]|uniref:Uncharacterized protein n=1 Tax=Anaeramoeba ignava TaxID=1746090 RepID=A0A9Q0LD27_ANAIG|nr:hypothetical protein M0811_01907 [Anaeramoeba ignava]
MKIRESPKQNLIKTSQMKIQYLDTLKTDEFGFISNNSINGLIYSNFELNDPFLPSHLNYLSGIPDNFDLEEQLNEIRQIKLNQQTEKIELNQLNQQNQNQNQKSKSNSNSNSKSY